MNKLMHFLMGLVTIAALSSYFVGASFVAHASDDKTGTNPINFTNDFRIYNEFMWLNAPGNSYQNVTTMEYRTPIADGDWQFRIRGRYVGLNVDGVFDEDGMGEVDFRLLTVPYIDLANGRAMAAGFEVFLPTAENGLGSQRVSFGPQVFGVFFLPFGIPNSLIAPAYQHKFSVWEDDGVDPLHQGLFDLFFLKTSEDKQRWMMINPQFVVDYEEGSEFGNIDVEFGTMLDEYLGTTGKSVYVRPGAMFLDDRPVNYSLEIGFKSVW